MTYILGCDISRYQGAVDFNKMKSAGARFVICRATVGDYYTDPTLQANIRGARAAGLIAGAYLVTAPADTAGRRISAAEHLQRFTDATEWLPINMRHTVDNELARGQDPWWVTTVIQGVFQGLPAYNGRKAANYTRQNWWDASVRAWSGWGDYDLFAARYLGGRMTDKPSPWWDGQYRFRDYDAWSLWQFSAKGNGLGHTFGCESADVDLDVFNGTWDEFVAWSGAQDAEPPGDEPVDPTILEKLTALETKVTALTADTTALKAGAAALAARVAALEAGAKPAARVTVKADKTLARFAAAANKAGKPIMAIYPSDTSKVTDRIKWAQGTVLEVLPEPVVADGGGRYWQLAARPAGVKCDLYVVAGDVG